MYTHSATYSIISYCSVISVPVITLGTMAGEVKSGNHRGSEG